MGFGVGVPLTVRSRQAVTALLVAGSVGLHAQPERTLNDQLHEAALTGQLERVRTLLDDGADVNARGRYDVTPISSAADQGHLEIVRLLLDRGADPDVIDTFYRFAPVSRALGGGHDAVAELLLDRGADPSPAVQFAIQTGQTERLEGLLMRGEIDADTLRRALLTAEARGMTPVAEALRAAGATTELPDAETVAIDAVRLRALAGQYVELSTNRRIDIVVDGEGLALRREDDDPIRLRPIAARTFRGIDAPLQLDFIGRGSRVEAIEYAKDGTLSMLGPFDPDTAALGERSGPAGEPAPETADRRSRPRTESLNWASFRGPNASGIGDGQGIPTRWDVQTGENVRWRTSIPGIANSSPIVWGNRVFLTTAVGSGDDTVRTGLYGDTSPVDDLSEHSFRVYALDTASGDIVWEREVFRGPPVTKRHPKSSQAQSTPVADAERVVALFGTIGRLVCFDHDGAMLWERDLGVLDSGWFYDPTYQWGHGSSPILYNGTVIVQADIQQDSYIAAYDLTTGDEVWRSDRDDVPTWGTPTLYRGSPRDELVTNGKTIRSYDPATGELLWWLAPNSELPVTTPLVGDGLVYLSNSYPPIQRVYAVRLGGRGDLSLSESESNSDWVAWSKNRSLSYLPTPIVYEEIFYTPSDNGRLLAYDALNGNPIYRARIGGGPGAFVASPVASDGRLFFTTEDCTVHVVRSGPEFEMLASNDMDDVCWATPAITNGLLIVRTLNHVYGIGSD